MGNNFFLTGDLHVGKTTLVNRIVKNLPLTSVSGFQTSRYYKGDKLEGFYIEKFKEDTNEMEKQFIGKCINQNCWVSIPSTFDHYGVNIINNALKDSTELIIMDELGFFENEAVHFHQKVFMALDSDVPVLGVLKQKETPFLDTIRERNDIYIFRITEDNREEMFHDIMNRIQKVLNIKKKEVPIETVDYDATAQEIFKPVYPVIAKQIKEKTLISKGVCLDIGTGTGMLGIEMARITDLKIYLMDISQDMLDMAEENIIHYGLKNRVETMVGDVHRIPVEDQTVDLIISRGSLLFWKDKKKAFKEIYRILAPGGIAYIGGGFGTIELKRKIDKEMQQRDQCWRQNMNKKVDKTNIDYEAILKAVEIENYQVISNEANKWIVIKRESHENVVIA